MRIRSQFLFVILCVGLLPLLAIGYVSYLFSKSRLEREAAKNLKTMNLLISSELDAYINTTKERIRARSVQTDVREYLEPNAPPLEQKRLLNVLDGFRNIDPVNMASIALLTQTGEKLADTDAMGQKTDERGKDWLVKPMASGSPMIFAEGSNERDLLLWIGIPLRVHSGEIRGVLRVRIQLAALQQIVSRLSDDKTAFAIVVDQNARILAHGKSPQLIGLTDRYHFPENAKDPLYLPDKVRNLPDDPVDCRVSVMELDHAPWTVAVFQTTPSFESSVSELQHFMWFCGVAALVLCSIAALLASTILSRPIAALAATAETIDGGHPRAAFHETGPDEVRGLAKAFNAMTERLHDSSRQLQAKMREAEEKEARMRELISLSPVAVAVADESGTIIQLNRAFTALFGYDISHLPTMGSWWEAILPDSKERNAFIESLKNRALEATDSVTTMAGIELDVVARDGSVKSVDFRARQIGPRFLTVCNDMTDRRRAELEVIRLNSELEHRVAARTNQLANANAELESFSYAVSHDLRSPLRAMDGFSRALEEDYANKLDEEGLGYLRRIRAASQKMGLLIDDLLKLARVSRSEVKREPMDLSQVAASIVQRLRNENPSRQVEFTCAPKLMISGDRSLIQIAMENLLENAWKYSRKKEIATIELGCKTDVQNDGTLDITYFIKDNGAGFDMRYAGKLFGAFQRLHSATEFEGTGVGLATVRRVINRHGGRIWAQAAPEKGAAFYFTVPRSESESPFSLRPHSRAPFHPHPSA